jgi:pimeloyl-ACP methyl ester carboxylesterase
VSSAIPAADLRHIITDDGVTLAAHRVGSSTGPPVLLVHGTFSNATFWLGTRGVGFARFLADCGYDVWCLETRGHGSSDRPTRTQRWDFDDWARHDMPAAIHACTSHTNPAVLIGHSAGGAAIVAALAANPLLQARVRGIVLIGTPLPWLQRWRGLAARAIRMYSNQRRWFPAKALGLGPEDELAGVMAQWMSWNINERWVGNDGTDYDAAFPRLSVPSFVIAASGDRMWAPPPSCRALFDRLGSRDRTYLLCGTGTGFTTDFTHVSVMIGRAAQAEIWPVIRNWVSALR